MKIELKCGRRKAPIRYMTCLEDYVNYFCALKMRLECTQAYSKPIYHYYYFYCLITKTCFLRNCLILLGQHLTLPLLGCVLELHIPATSSRHTDNSNETVTVSGSGVPQTPLPDLFPTLLPLLEHLHCLWELVLTAEPVVVLAPSPTQCSTTVQALTTIIHPLRCSHISFCNEYMYCFVIATSFLSGPSRLN